MLERAKIINIQALGDQMNHSVILWQIYYLNINKTGIFAVQFYFLVFFIVKNDHVTFSKAE